MLSFQQFSQLSNRWYLHTLASDLLLLSDQAVQLAVMFFFFLLFQMKQRFHLAKYILCNCMTDFLRKLRIILHDNFLKCLPCLLYTSIYQPLRKITEAATQYASGNLTYEIPVRTEDELSLIHILLHLTASHSSYIPYYFNLFSIISSLYSSAIMSRLSLIHI